MAQANNAEERLRKIIADQLGVSEDEVVPEASFIDDLNADSLEMVDLIISLEEEFGVQVSDEDAEKIKTVKDAIDYLNDHLDLPRHDDYQGRLRAGPVLCLGASDLS